MTDAFMFLKNRQQRLSLASSSGTSRSGNQELLKGTRLKWYQAMGGRTATPSAGRKPRGHVMLGEASSCVDPTNIRRPVSTLEAGDSRRMQNYHFWSWC